MSKWRIVEVRVKGSIVLLAIREESSSSKECKISHGSLSKKGSMGFAPFKIKSLKEVETFVVKT